MRDTSRGTKQGGVKVKWLGARSSAGARSAQARSAAGPPAATGMDALRVYAAVTEECATYHVMIAAESDDAAVTVAALREAFRQPGPVPQRVMRAVGAGRCVMCLEPLHARDDPAWRRSEYSSVHMDCTRRSMLLLEAARDGSGEQHMFLLAFCRDCYKFCPVWGIETKARLPNRCDYHHASLYGATPLSAARDSPASGTTPLGSADLDTPSSPDGRPRDGEHGGGGGGGSSHDVPAS